MPPHPGPPLTKITINLYTEDVIFIKAHFGDGWQVEIRELISQEMNKRKDPFDGK